MMGLIDGIVFAFLLFFMATTIAFAGFGELNNYELMVAKACVLASCVMGIGLAIYYLYWNEKLAVSLGLATIGLIGAVLCAATLGSLYWLDHRASLMLARSEGTLAPGDWTTPVHPDDERKIGPDGIKVFLGPVLTSTERTPWAVIKINNEALFVVEREKKSHLRITLLKVFDTRGDIIARIDDEGFWLSPGSKKLARTRAHLLFSTTTATKF
jgi:amino acid transporter